MKQLFKLMLFFVGLAVAFISCEPAQSVLDEEINEKTIFSFDSTNDFFDAFDKLAMLTNEEQIEWCELHGLRASSNFHGASCEDEYMLKMPRAFQLLFNKDMEVQINDSIIYFSNGSLYVKSYKSQSLPIPSLWGEVWINDSVPPQTKSVSTYITPYNKIGTSYQMDIEIPNNKYRFKYVHELKSVGITIFPQQEGLSVEHMSRLFLVLKLEYKGKSWHVAGEARNIYIDLNVCKRNLLGISGNQEILIDINSSFRTPAPHVTTIFGSIIHEVIGYPGTKKINNWGSGVKLPWS